MGKNTKKSNSRVEASSSVINSRTDEKGIHTEDKGKLEEEQKSGEGNFEKISDYEDIFATAASAFISPLVCSHCGNEFPNWTSKKMTICPTCADKVSMYVDILRGTIKDKILQDFNMIKIAKKDIPLMDCTCSHEFVLVFDFYTKPIEEGYQLVLNCICKGCRGYRNVPLEQAIFPIMIKTKTPHSGISLTQGKDFLDKKGKDIGNLYT